MKMRSGAKKIKVGNNVTTFQIKTKKIKSIMHKYKNKDGKTRNIMYDNHNFKIIIT